MRYPPKGEQDYEGYPKVHWNNWCGEWQDSIPNQAMPPDLQEQLATLKKFEKLGDLKTLTENQKVLEAYRRRGAL